MVLAFLVLFAWLALAIVAEMERGDGAPEAPAGGACPGCARPVESDWLLCPRCRTLLKSACSGCGRQGDLWRSFCPWCGRPRKEGE